MKCLPCTGVTPRLKGAALKKLQRQLKDWKVIKGHHLAREYKFPNFVKALAFVNRIGTLAEKIGHHPDLELGWGRVGVEIWTHSVNGLTQNDFIFAAKVDRL